MTIARDCLRLSLLGGLDEDDCIVERRQMSWPINPDFISPFSDASEDFEQSELGRDILLEASLGV